MPRAKRVRGENFQRLIVSPRVCQCSGRHLEDPVIAGLLTPRSFYNFQGLFRVVQAKVQLRQSCGSFQIPRPDRCSSGKKTQCLFRRAFLNESPTQIPMTERQRMLQQRRRLDGTGSLAVNRVGRILEYPSVGRKKVQILNSGLRDQHSIKWILVNRRKLTGLYGVSQTYGQRSESFVAEN